MALEDYGNTAFYVYDTATGEILRTGVCPLRDLELQAGAGETVEKGVADCGEHKVVNGDLVEMTQEEKDAKKPTVLPFEKQSAFISNEQWESLVERVSALEIRSIS
jgi:hypothetical protein